MPDLTKVFLSPNEPNPIKQNSVIRQLLESASSNLYPLNTNNIYIATTGNDSNTGTVSTSPLLTFGAVLTLAAQMRGGVSINIVDGTYDITSPISVFGEHAINGRHVLNFNGNVGSPANVIIRANTASQKIFDVEDFGGVIISGVTLVANTGINGVIGVYSRQHAIADFSNTVFGSMPSGTHAMADEGGTLNEGTNVTVSGGANSHNFARDGGIITLNGAVTVTGTPAFGIAFVNVLSGGLLTSDNATITYTGSAIGPAFSYDSTARVVVGSTVFPGSAGTDLRILQTGPTALAPTDNSGASLSFTNNGSYYYKNGKFVEWCIDITYPATANTASASLAGFPALPAGSIVLGDMGILQGSTANWFFAIVSGTQINLYTDSTLTVHLRNVDLSGLNIRFVAKYFTN